MNKSKRCRVCKKRHKEGTEIFHGKGKSHDFEFEVVDNPCRPRVKLVVKAKGGI